jgi:N-acetylglutamate synthase-like GNAT family acetyltransferase
VTLTTELLTSEHFVEIGMGRGQYEVSGYALRDDDGRLQACGGLWFLNGMAVATFWARPGWQPKPRVHRLAIRIVHAAMRAGVTEIWAEEDSRVPSARKWLERFGFERAGHATDGLPVWRLDLDGRSRDAERDGSWRRWHERGGLDQSGPGGERCGALKPAGG